QLMGMSEVQRNLLRTYISEFTARMPIHKRISVDKISYLISKELRDYNLDTDFEFGVYNNSLATKVHTGNFSFDHPATYSVPLYVDTAGNSDYQLLVNFTGKKK